MDEKTFMDDLMVAFDDRARVILNRVDQKDWDLLVGVIESTDRVQHMMWRLIDPKHPLYDANLAAQYGDSIERVYRRADDFVGEVVKRVGPGVPVMIVSDHGFHSWRKAVNLEYLAGAERLHGDEGPAGADKKLSDLFGGGTFWENVDWSRTKAYAMGIGQIYFNLRGRESQGIVSPGAEAKALADELGGEAADDDRPGRRDEDHPRGLQARRHLHPARSCRTRRSCRSAWTKATACRGRRRWADRRRASSTRTIASGAPTTAGTTSPSRRACS